MAIKLGDAFVRLYTDSTALNKGLDDARQKTSSTANVMQGVFQGVGQAIFGAVKTGISAAINEMGKAVTRSSDLNEAINKTGVVFGSAAADVVQWSTTTANSMGVSQNAALNATGSFGALFKQMGALPAVAAANSKELVQLAADLGSIYNIPIEDALLKIQSGLAGESEPLRALNIFLTENAVKQEAMRLGLAASTDAVSEAAKVEARRNLILQGGAIAQGDFANTSLGLANAQKRLTAIIEDGSRSLGDSFRPAVESITNALVGVAPQMFEYGSNILDQLAAGMAAGIRALLPVIQTVRQLFTYWFAPGSPPKVLPDIDKWGAAAMGQFLKGFSSVDVKAAVDTVGSAIEGILRSDVSAGKASESGLVSRVFGTRDAIMKAVAEFARAGSVSDSTISKIVRSAGGAGKGIGDLVKSYFDLQKASTAATRAQDDLNRITEKYDSILDPLRDQLDGVRAEQQALANQQRLIAAQNTLVNFDATDAEKRAAALDIQQISLENQINTAEQKKDAETSAAQAQLDAAKKQEESAKKQLDIAQATIDQQVQTNNLLAEQRQLEERIANEREAAANKAEAEAERAKAAAEQLHQAQLQYQLGIANTQGKLALLRGELAKTASGSAEYYGLLGQIASLEEQSADEAKRNAEQVSDAQFSYNLELADTNGKIALYQEKLKSVVEGSAEYFNILSKIHSLQEQAAKGGGSGVVGGLDLPTLPSGEDLSKMFETPGGGSLKEAIEEAFAPVGPATESVKKLGDSLSSLASTIGTLIGIDFKSWLEGNKQATDTTGWDHYGIVVAANTAAAQQNADEAAEAMRKSAEDTDLALRQMQSNGKVVMDIWRGDWKQFWIDWAENVRLGNEASEKNSNESWTRLRNLNTFFTAGIFDDNAKWWGDMLGQGVKWFRDLSDEIAKGLLKVGTLMYDGGNKLVTRLWDGLKLQWDELKDWFSNGLGGLSDLLPHSEPKDPSSPLRGLKERGAALVDMFQSGIDAASFNINPLANSLLPLPDTGAASAPTSSNPIFNFGGITINGAVNAEDVRKGLAQGADDIISQMRASGVSY